MTTIEHFEALRDTLEGDFFFDKLHRVIYSTDASAYKQEPLAVAYPKNKEDIKKIIHFAKQQKISVIPRTAGTSLAGQVVGDGIIVDVSKYLTEIVELNVLFQSLYGWWNGRKQCLRFAFYTLWKYPRPFISS